MTRFNVRARALPALLALCLATGGTLIAGDGAVASSPVASTSVTIDSDKDLRWPGRKPTVVGKPKVGATLSFKVRPPADGWTYEFQWMRGNKPIKGEVDTTYTTTSADKGYALWVDATAVLTEKRGEEITSQRSVGVNTNAIPIGKVATDVALFPDKRGGQGPRFDPTYEPPANTPLDIYVGIHVPSRVGGNAPILPKGKVKVKVGSKSRTLKLKATKQHVWTLIFASWVTFKHPGLPAGKHKVTIKYLGAKNFAKESGSATLTFKE
jgi:hypothetical protein